MMEFFVVDFPSWERSLSRGGSHRKTLCHYIITYPKIAILGSKSVNHSPLPISSQNRVLLLCQRTTDEGRGGKFANSILQRSKNLVIFIKLYRNIDGRIATFLQKFETFLYICFRIRDLKNLGGIFTENPEHLEIENQSIMIIRGGQARGGGRRWRALALSRRYETALSRPS